MYSKINMHNITATQRTCMVLCPCKYLNTPDLTTSDCCLCCHESPKADLLTIPPYIEISGTCLKASKPINIVFIIFRFISMFFVIYMAVFSFYLYAMDGNAIYFFIYFTQWVTILAVLLSVLRFMSSVKVYGSDKRSDAVYEIDIDDCLWGLYKLHTIVLQITLPAITMVTFNYWLFVYDGDYSSTVKMISSYQLHALLCIVLWSDFLISAERMYYKSAFWSVMLGTMYTVWSVIFEVFINMNEEGNPYIYSSYDWSKSIITPLIYYCLSVVILTVFTSLAAFIKNMILISSGIGDKHEMEDRDSEVPSDDRDSEIPFNDK